jgi:hypothetical protein
MTGKRLFPAAASSVVAVAAFCAACATLQAATLYVDTSLSSDCPGTYDPSTRSCGGGGDVVYHTLAGGLAAVRPGDVLLLREGSYGQLAPPAAGVAGSPITIRGYPGERAAIENLGSTVAIWMEGLSYIILEDLVIDNALATEDPRFVDELGYDFRLAPSSSFIDFAGFVTTTVSAGSGTSLPVHDALFFYDGYGIAGEIGDLIQLEGQSVRSRVVAVDDQSHTLTLDQPLSWGADQGVHLAYVGIAPDAGAFEFGLDEGLLFGDGFEAGDTSAWSATSP